MSKQIVICMDGTWNDPTERTNVYKLFSLLSGKEQAMAGKGPIRSHLLKKDTGHMAYYLEGVGANGRGQGVLGGSLGVGLHDRVIDAFVLFSQIYVRGDKVWIFGFSRGAWSARSLAGLIARAGVLDNAEADDAAARAEQLWLETKHGSAGHDFWQGKDDLPIKLVGVWDTVGALGIPFFNGLRIFDRLEKSLFDFADLDLSPHVEFGRHAMAVDESRFDFTPARWNDRQGIKQVWFSGVHSDVGGGYPHSGLSDIALQWMVDEVNALQAGLQLMSPQDADEFKFAPDFLEDRHEESRGVIWQLRPIKPRDISPQAVLHQSVNQRLAGRNDYRPAALRKVTSCAAYFPTGAVAPREKLQSEHEISAIGTLDPGQSKQVIVFAQNWWNAAGLKVRKGETYTLMVRGNWQDKNTETDANGYPSPNLLLKTMEGTRRARHADWFALVAALNPAPDLELKNPDSGNFLTTTIESATKNVGEVDNSSQLLAAGAGLAELVPDRDGFLYFFANDSAFAYSNNSGFLNVVVTRTA